MNSALACVIIVFLSTLSLRRATLKALYMILSLKNFYPRSPCGERQGDVVYNWLPYAISIHALLAESDKYHPSVIPAQANFYPRSPCGERQSALRRCSSVLLFLSTLSLRRATSIERCSLKEFMISIHALLAESDFGEINTRGSKKVFLSTLSLRRATREGPRCQGLSEFLSTLSLRRATAL